MRGPTAIARSSRCSAARSPAAAVAAVGGERSSDYDEHYFRTTPRLETGDERYVWVNQTIFVGEGRIHPGPVVEYRVHRVT